MSKVEHYRGDQKILEKFLITFPDIDHKLHLSAWEGMYQRYYGDETFMRAYEYGDEELTPELYEELIELKYDLAEYEYDKCHDIAVTDPKGKYGKYFKFS